MKILIFLLTINLFAKNLIPASRFELLSGGSRDSSKSAWDKKYSKKGYVYGKAPEKFLAENYSYIPKGAKVLDVGVGEGRHAVFLAGKGYKVVGIDISSVALKKTRMLAREYKVRVETILGSFRTYEFNPGEFDAIINFYFVDHSIHDELLRALKPGGVLIYEAFTKNQMKKKGFERSNPKHMLRPGELLNLFPEMKVLKYEEPLHENKFRSSIILKKSKT